MPAIDNLVNLISKGYPEVVNDQVTNSWKETIDAVFGERYRADSPRDKRVVLIPNEENISFAGLIHPDNPNSGAYGGFCLVWFPKKATEGSTGKSLLAFGCGTRGLSPDENILARPGHVRYLQALRKFIAEQTGIFTWCKHDPANLAENIPDAIRKQFPDFSDVFSRYGSVLHFLCEIPQDEHKASIIVKAFLDFYAWERSWKVLQAAKKEFDELFSEIQKRVFPTYSEDEVFELLRERYYVILQGPPGTGKTRLANIILAKYFSNVGKVIQFHPATTYENFIIGIQPNVENKELSFSISNGFLLDSIDEAKNKEKYLLLIDEINRADLGKVLGEAIALFEYKEVKENNSRLVTLPFKNLVNNQISLPSNLYLLGTMNSADRSIAILDLAVRRRFAFIDIWPQKNVVDEQDLELASEAFSRLQEIFIQYASEENLVLLPGHSYFLAEDKKSLINRFKFELIPLLQEYLRDGRVASMDSQIQGYIDWLDLAAMS
jgi:5-methylcytosine-specific restriction protein B